MNEKEITELRRRFKPEKSNITHIRGCYVNEQGSIISQLDQSLCMMTQDETEFFLNTLRRTLSGTLGKNLVDIPFTTAQVQNSEEHRLLMTLRDTSLKDDEAVDTLFRKVRENLTLEGNYLILLVSDSYDVPYRAKDGAELEDVSEETFHYILCSICPVKPTKPALSYFAQENAFHTRKLDWLLSPPQAGFLFPAFDDRRANIYNTLYYTRDPADNHPELVEALFHCPSPMSAAEQKETFQSLLSESLEEECSLEVVDSVQQHLLGLIEVHKETHEEAPLSISKETVNQVLASCGVSPEKISSFQKTYTESFGADTGLSPRNLVDLKRMELKTQDVTVHVNAERDDLVSTRIIDGARYLLIRVEDSLEVNGVPVQIS